MYGDETRFASGLTPDALDTSKDTRGLVPAVVQDVRSGEVLMLSWQNREALSRTIASGMATFWSRSRQTLWQKGATSGFVQRLRGAAVDCDLDAVLLQVDPGGPACHTGERTCFHRGLIGAPMVTSALRGVASLEHALPTPPVKVGETATALAIACVRGDRREILDAAAELFDYVLGALGDHHITLLDVAAELERRRKVTRRDDGR